MTSKVTPEFWKEFRKLPSELKALARKTYALWLSDSSHPSLHFKKVGCYWTCRVGIHYRAVALKIEDCYAWFWIGHHAVYDRILKQGRSL